PLAQLVALLRQKGELQPALQWARRAVAADPLREEAHQDVIQLLLETGQGEAALRQYRELERLLCEQLGATPSPDARALIRGLERSGARASHRSQERRSDQYSHGGQAAEQ